MKNFNRPENVVEEMLQGLAVLNPGVARLSGHKVMVRADINKIRDREVAIISGGGSGYEPAHAGYIGEGMLVPEWLEKSLLLRTPTRFFVWLCAISEVLFAK
jgi:dihydroxyacetone kinase